MGGKGGRGGMRGGAKGRGRGKGARPAWGEGASEGPESMWRRWTGLCSATPPAGKQEKRGRMGFRRQVVLFLLHLVML